MKRMLRMMPSIWWTCWGLWACAAPLELGNGFADHGGSVPADLEKGVFATTDGAGRNVALVWLQNEHNPCTLLLVDVESGTSEQIGLPFRRTGEPTASLLSRRNKLYACVGNSLVEFDPDARAFAFHREVSDTGIARWSSSLAEDEKGVLWVAAYLAPSVSLMCFNPDTRECKVYPKIFTVPQYAAPSLGPVATDDAGWAYWVCSFDRGQILAFNPSAGQPAVSLAMAQMTNGGGRVYRGGDGKVYGYPGQETPGRYDDGLYEFYRGEARKVSYIPPEEERSKAAGQHGLYTNFPDGNRIQSCNLVNHVLAIEDTRNGVVKRIDLQFKYESTPIGTVAVAPGGMLCATGGREKLMFSYSPAAGRWSSHECYYAWDTMTRQGDRLFVGSVGSLLAWDVSSALEGDTAYDMYSRSLAVDCRNYIGTVHELLACPDGNTVIAAGEPGRKWEDGGWLLFWDCQARTPLYAGLGSVLPRQATFSLVALPDSKLLGGTAVERSYRQATGQPELYIMDMASKRIEWHAAPFTDVVEYVDLCRAPNGLVYGIAEPLDTRPAMKAPNAPLPSRFFVLDPVQRKVIHQTNLAPGHNVWNDRARTFVAGADGSVYMFFKDGIGRINPATHGIKMLAPSPIEIQTTGDYLDGRIYFGSGSHLYSYEVPSTTH